MRVWAGDPSRLGAIWDGTGVNVAVYSEPAERVELCLFDADGSETRVDLPSITAFVHHGYFPALRPGQRYGFRVHGPWSPADGVLCNPNKLLTDPYAHALEGDLEWDDSIFAFKNGSDELNPLDSAPSIPRSVVVDQSFDWGTDQAPRTPLYRTIIYETHVRGISMTHPDVPGELRGTYAGLASDPIVEHLLSLGVTAVELLPVHHHVSEHHLVKEGLTNYWGYNTLGFFAPHADYAIDRGHGPWAGSQVVEFKNMVKALHRAGIEVILDVVYNHTAEGNQGGPMLSLKGFDNPAYYRLSQENKRHYVDYTGTGNSLNMRHSQSLQLMMDSLRFWITEMHVDGFRFDLASALARGLHEVDRLSSFFDLIHQDPVVNRVKLIAEPWDVGEGGYQVGNFPPLWSEWNARYRDGVRDYWRGADESLADFASRLTGSSDLYAWSGRRPSASINFVTAHDGFTLHDLVSYNEKHNEANGEDNRDGESHNRSWNSGVEGPTDDPKILDIRKVRRRSILTTLLLSQGIPMLLGGDELGRTQHGNNNGYCQDNELSWYDWENVDEELLAFVRRLGRFRSEHPTFRRRRWFEGRDLHGSDVFDIEWFSAGGKPMTDDDWNNGLVRSLMVYLNGQVIPAPDYYGNRITDDSFLLLFNPSGDATKFHVPDGLEARTWRVEIDTATDHRRDAIVDTKDVWTVAPWALVVLQMNGS
ncbi:MAG: glycogen debranching protein GlgX [Acidimicrobiia bacterium]|nr:glycogen debranching protein GlgX [Acidimicrobiia bacterium]